MEMGPNVEKKRIILYYTRINNYLSTNWLYFYYYYYYFFFFYKSVLDDKHSNIEYIKEEFLKNHCGKREIKKGKSWWRKVNKKIKK